jgi:hypothetical protein
MTPASFVNVVAQDASMIEGGTVGDGPDGPMKIDPPQVLSTPPPGPLVPRPNAMRTDAGDNDVVP